MAMTVRTQQAIERIFNEIWFEIPYSENELYNIVENIGGITMATFKKWVNVETICRENWVRLTLAETVEILNDWNDMEGFVVPNIHIHYELRENQIYRVYTYYKMIVHE